ncbi:MAG: hypothetical protein ACOX3T_03840 [Bdellovibrionota bacterium]|jgi:hypothetical protein
MIIKDVGVVSNSENRDRLTNQNKKNVEKFAKPKAFKGHMADCGYS